MAKRSALRSDGSAGEVTFNMTPMIDCVFQLILFFLLTSQVASANLPRMELFRPLESQAQISKDRKFPYKVIVNVLSDREETKSGVKGPIDPRKAARARAYVVGGKYYDASGKRSDKEKFTLAKLEEILRKRWKETAEEHKSEFFVEIRADKDVHFNEIVPVMEIAAKVGIVKMNLTALAKSRRMR